MICMFFSSFPRFSTRRDRTRPGDNESYLERHERTAPPLHVFEKLRVPRHLHIRRFFTALIGNDGGNGGRDAVVETT